MFSVLNFFFGYISVFISSFHTCTAVNTRVTNEHQRESTSPQVGNTVTSCPVINSSILQTD